MSFSASVLSSIESPGPRYEPLVDHLSTPSKEKDDRKYAVIQWLHFAASITFLVLIIAFAATNVDASIDPIVQKPVNCDDFCDVEVQNLGDINFRFLIPLILAIAYIHHLVCFLVCYFHDDAAEVWIFAIGSNPERWIEYSITFPLTVVVVAILAGIMDVHLWLQLFFLTALCMGLWQVLELLPRQERHEHPVSFRTLRELTYGLGVTALCAPWLVILCYYARQLSDNDTPAYISVTVLGVGLLFVTVALHTYVSNVLCWYDFCTSEVVYISLSLVTKLFLATTVYAGLHK